MKSLILTKYALLILAEPSSSTVSSAKAIVLLQPPLLNKLGNHKLSDNMPDLSTHKKQMNLLYLFGYNDQIYLYDAFDFYCTFSDKMCY